MQRTTPITLSILAAAALTIIPVAANAQSPIPLNKPAPELTGSTWLNTAYPITLSSRRGKVTIVEFWTADCIDCKRNFPTYARWATEFRNFGVQVISVHTPETKWETAPSFVKHRTSQYKISYPVLVDSSYANWNRWNQKSWPTVYLVDKKGIIRYQWVGELDADGADGTRQMSKLIAQLIHSAA